MALVRAICAGGNKKEFAIAGQVAFQDFKTAAGEGFFNSGFYVYRIDV